MEIIRFLWWKRIKKNVDVKMFCACKLFVFFSFNILNVGENMIIISKKKKQRMLRFPYFGVDDGNGFAQVLRLLAS